MQSDRKRLFIYYFDPYFLFLLRPPIVLGTVTMTEMPRHAKNRQQRDEAGKTSPRAKCEAFFALTAELFYNPQAPISDLAQELGLATSTVKRMLGLLRRNNVVHGRAGAIRLTLSHVAEHDASFCAGLVQINPDSIRPKKLRNSDRGTPYRMEEGLLGWLCDVLPRTDPFRGKIIVENGHIIMGAVDFGLVITVYAASPGALFDFARFGVEMADGVRRTRTLMITHTAR